MAGTVLLWERQEIDQISLWRLTKDGYYSGHYAYQDVPNGYRARAVTHLAGGCLPPAHAYGDVAVVFEPYDDQDPVLVRVYEEEIFTPNPGYRLEDLQPRTDPYFNHWHASWEGNSIQRSVIDVYKDELSASHKIREQQYGPIAGDMYRPPGATIAGTLYTQPTTDSGFEDLTLWSLGAADEAMLAIKDSMGIPMNHRLLQHPQPDNNNKWEATGISSPEASDFICLPQPPIGPPW